MNVRSNGLQFGLDPWGPLTKLLVNMGPCPNPSPTCALCTPWIAEKLQKSLEEKGLATLRSVNRAVCLRALKHAVEWDHVLGVQRVDGEHEWIVNCGLGEGLAVRAASRLPPETNPWHRRQAKGRAKAGQHQQRLTNFFSKE